MSVYRCVLFMIVSLLLTTFATAQPKAGSLKIKPYTFENDKKEKIDAEFGALLVPENRSNPESNLIELAFVRFKSTAKNPGDTMRKRARGFSSPSSGVKPSTVKLRASKLPESRHGTNMPVATPCTPGSSPTRRVTS